MRNIAIIGSGQAGLLAAHGLIKAGYHVTLYSDRTADQWLNESRPTGTAARFHISLEYERELGLNHWEKDAPKGEGVHLTFSPSKDNRLLTLAGRLKDYFIAVDLRLQSHRWMNDFAAKGGRIEIENVTVARLDEIAAAHELTIVAAGRADLCNLFERDAARSVYDKPQRNLTMIITTGGKMGFAGVPFLPVKFNFFAPFGEAFYVPYFHKDHGPTWNMLIEAKAGGPLDRFGDCKSGEQAVELYKQIIKEVIPWDYEWAKDMQLADPNGWLVGRFAPTVRKPVGRLPSGRIVTPLGDTAMALDPVGGQGANNGNKMARNLVESIVARKDQPFDAQWMTETFERFYARYGGHHVHIQQPLAGADHDRRQAAPDRAIWQRRPRTRLNRPATDRRRLHREFQRRQRPDRRFARRRQGPRRDQGKNRPELAAGRSARRTRRRQGAVAAKAGARPWPSGRALITLAPRRRIATCSKGAQQEALVLTSFVFRRQMTVEFGHCDPARMVTPKHLFEYFDTGTWSLFEAALGIKRQDFLNVFGILPLVDVRLDCRKTVTFGESIEIASRIAEFRRSSFDVEHRVISGGELAVLGGETRVWAVRDKDDPEKISARPIPDDVIARFG